MTFDPRELVLRLRKLPIASTANRLDLEPIARSVSLSRTTDGDPCLVFEVSDRPQTVHQSTQALLTKAHPEADLVMGGSSRKSAIVIIALRDNSFDWHFAVLAAEVADIATSRADAFSTSRQVRDHLARWYDVFRRREMTYKKALGLWGELHMLTLLGDADRAVDAWHGPDAAIFDFAANDIAVEVKTAERKRRHWFDLRQIPGGTKPLVMIASIVTERDPASGETLMDKVELVRSKLSSHLVFEQKLVQVGFDPTISASVKVRATDVVALYARDVPRPRVLDDGVEEVKFLVDLTDAKPMPPKTWASLVDNMLAV